MYDVIIVGRDLSAFIAALASTRQGLKTVLITEGPPEESYCEGGYTFYSASLPLAGMGRSRLALKVLDDLQLFPEGFSSSPLSDPIFQVILPEHRVDIFNDRQRTLGDLFREFPENRKEIEIFYNKIEKGGDLIDQWLGKDFPWKPEGIASILHCIRNIPAFLSSYCSLRHPQPFQSQSFRSMIEAELAAFSSLDFEANSPPLSAAYLLCLPWKGLFQQIGGRNDFIRVLCRKFEESGGILMKGCKVIRLETSPDIMVDLECECDPLKLRGKRLIVSLQWEQLHSLLLGRKEFRRLNRLFKSIQYTGFPFSLHLGIHEEAIPEHMARYSAVVQKERGLMGQNIVFLDSSLPNDSKRAPSGKRSMTATVFLNHSPLMTNDEKLKQVASDIFLSLEGYLPFLRDNIDYIHIERSIAFSRISQETVGLRYHFKRPQILGINTLSPETAIPGVFITGGMLKAGLGFEGEVLSGVQSALLAGMGINKSPL